MINTAENFRNNISIKNDPSEIILIWWFDAQVTFLIGYGIIQKFGMFGCGFGPVSYQSANTHIHAKRSRILYNGHQMVLLL